MWGHYASEPLWLIVRINDFHPKKAEWADVLKMCDIYHHSPEQLQEKKQSSRLTYFKIE